MKDPGNLLNNFGCHKKLEEQIIILNIKLVIKNFISSLQWWPETKKIEFLNLGLKKQNPPWMFIRGRLGSTLCAEDFSLLQATNKPTI